MTNRRWRAVLYGAAAFLMAHGLERVMWSAWFADMSLVPWFTNSGRAVIVTTVFMFVAGLLSATGASDQRERIAAAWGAAGGGIAAMIVALVITGGGTIAPLVIVIGAALVIVGTFAGMLAASARR